MADPTRAKKFLTRTHHYRLCWPHTYVYSKNLFPNQFCFYFYLGYGTISFDWGPSLDGRQIFHPLAPEVDYLIKVTLNSSSSKCSIAFDQPSKFVTFSLDDKEVGQHEMHQIIKFFVQS